MALLLLRRKAYTAWLSSQPICVKPPVNNKMDMTQEPHQSAHSPDHACTIPVAVKIEAEIKAAYASINNNLHETKSSPSPQVRRSSQILKQGGYGIITIPAGYLSIRQGPSKEPKTSSQ
ncbi:hypothetical protein PCANC_08497 [Puccinia coronata f. sp. avenae]|uniref:Uncharacterized protein n=2 Tax=Puccinia coronata f. sp. avenae TaxID=200324 RepID=A0A2N5T4A0_9BASI|nr:hypothetical protein PCANC_08497 [Puccinia coronata f. sp. avenae]